MTKKEFENRTGINVSEEAYERIEYVYMNCDFFNTNETMYDFYKNYDMNGIERMYRMILNTEAKDNEIKELNTKLFVTNLELEKALNLVTILKEFKGGVVNALAELGGKM